MFEKLILPNGLRVVLTRIPQVRSLSVGVWIKAGVINEDGYPNGIAHFAEHMLFKGTAKRTAVEIAREIEDIGGEINAFTSREYTCYYTKSLDEYADKCLDVLSDIYLNALIDKDTTEKEKSVIKQEISMYEDTPDELIHDLIIRTMWAGCLYGNPISGTKESLEGINNLNITDYVQKHYNADSTVISAAGNFDRDALLGAISQKFVYDARKEAIKPQVVPQYTPDVYYREKDTEQNHICIGFRGFDIFDDRIYDMSCFNSIFGSGMSSLLFQKIRDELGLVYSVYSYNASFTSGGSFIIYAGLEKSNTGFYFREVDKLISEFRTKIIPEDQLKVVKNKLRSNYILALESPSSIMNYTGSSELLKGYIDSPDRISEKIEEISVDSLYGSLGSVLDIKRSVVLIGSYNGSLYDFV